MPLTGHTIHPQTTISLAPGVRVADGEIIDESIDSRIPIAGVGIEILERFVAGEPVGQVGTAIAGKYNVPDNQVAGDIEAFVGELDGQGLISTRQSYLVGVRAFVRAIGAAAPSPLDLLMLDTSSLAQPTRRYPPNFLYVVLACLEAQSLLYLASFALILGAVIAKMIAAAQQHADVLSIGIFAVTRPVLALGIFALLFVCHEAGHLLALRALRMKVRSVAARMWGVGITYAPGTPLQMLVVAIAGPLSAFAFALGLALFVSTHSIPALGIGNLEVSYILLFGLLHAWSLRPWAGDGRQVASALLALTARHRRATNRSGYA